MWKHEIGYHSIILNQSYLKMWLLAFNFLLRVTVKKLSTCLFYTCVSYQSIFLGHIAIFCFVFSDRFYGRKSDHFLKSFIQLINGTHADDKDLKKRIFSYYLKCERTFKYLNDIFEIAQNNFIIAHIVSLSSGKQ